MLPVKLNPFGINVKSLPYDMEVEYLESTGTQKILNVLPFFANFELKVLLRSNVSGTTIYSSSRGNKLYIYNGFFRLGLNGSVYETTADPTLISYVSCRGGTFTINGVVFATCTNLFSQTPSCIFTQQTSSITASAFVLYYLKLYDQNDILVRDFIPVSTTINGQIVGALYDKANPKGGPNGNGMYYNDGTGDFIIGPDL